ncbi:MAG: hypothetical protein HJJLKODD_00698 [Phycisphaerae bacterium]|nr:hypothetical protein [Phycisphaerae bacterium]
MLRVATLNLAHGRGLARIRLGKPRSVFKRNLDSIAKVLHREKPDVLALQEADGINALSGAFDHLFHLKTAAEYDHHMHGSHVKVGIRIPALHHGTAILSRYELFESRSHAFRVDPTDTKGYVCAEIGFAGRRVLVVSVHLDFKFARLRRRQVRSICKTIEHAGKPLIIMGDLNCDWHQDDAIRLLVNQFNLDAWQPDSRELMTYRSNRPHRRIDWILISREMTFISHTVWPDHLSDHLAVAAELHWK